MYFRNPADLVGFSHNYGYWSKKSSSSQIEKCLLDGKGQMRMARLLGDNRKATVTQPMYAEEHL